MSRSIHLDSSVICDEEMFRRLVCEVLKITNMFVPIELLEIDQKIYHLQGAGHLNFWRCTYALFYHLHRCLTMI